MPSAAENPAGKPITLLVLAFFSLFAGTLFAAVNIEATTFPALLLGVLVGIVLLVRVDWLLWVLVFAVPFALYRDIGGLPLNSEILLKGVLLLACLVRIPFRRRIWVSTGVTLFVIALALLAGSSVFRLAAPDILSDIVRFLSNVVMFFCLLNIITSKEHLGAALNALFVGTILVCAYGLYQYFAIHDLGSVWDFLHPNLNEFWRDRIVSVLTTDNECAAYLNMVFPIIVFYYVRRKQQGWTISLLAPLTCLLIVFTVILTFSRGGWIATALLAAFLFLLFLGRRNIRLGLAVLGFLLASVVIANYLGFADLMKDRLNIDEQTFETRSLLLGAALNMFIAHPLIGVGFGNFQVLWPAHAEAVIQELPRVGPHNSYLFVLSQLGILGLISFVWLITSTCYRGFKLLPETERSPWAAVQMGIACSLATAMIHGFVDDAPFFTSHNQVFVWLLLGLFYAADRNRQNSVQGQEAHA